MAASLSCATKFLSALAHHNFSRRGYAAAAQGSVLVRSRVVKEEIGRSTESAWVPDPITGYYRPANRASEIDVAELRDLHLKQRIGSQ
ncbi:hypothetical protein V2J09_003189 [Rumex salicifolius]